MERARSGRRAAEAGDRGARRRQRRQGLARGSSATADLKARARARARRRAASRRGAGRSVPAAQPASRARARQAGDVQADRKPSPSPTRTSPEAHFAVALAAFNTGLTDMTDDRRPAMQRGRPRARAEARLGARRAAQGGDPRASDRRPRRSPTSTMFLERASGVESGRRRARAVLCRAEALRRSARDVRALWDARQGQPRLRVRRRRARRCR